MCQIIFTKIDIVTISWIFSQIWIKVNNGPWTGTIVCMTTNPVTSIVTEAFLCFSDEINFILIIQNCGSAPITQL